MSDQESKFKPRQPCVEVKQFIVEHPEADWQECLTFLLDNFPQQINGEVQYIIEGGTATQLLAGERQKQPKDIDMILTKDGLEGKFVNSMKFDTKTLKQWFEMRGLIYTQEKREFLLNQYIPVVLDGKQVLVLKPVILAVSKMLGYNGRSPRNIDVEDVESLSVSDEDVQQVINYLKNQ